MSIAELESFIFKFNHLWKTGQDARIDIHSHAGNAWIGISLNLGQYPGHQGCQDPPRKNVSPSRIRRRERRAAARSSNHTQDANFGSEIGEPYDTNQVAEEAAEDNVMVDAGLCNKLTPTEKVEESSAVVVSDNGTDDGNVVNQCDADVVAPANNGEGNEVCMNAYNGGADVVDSVTPSSNDIEKVANTQKEDDTRQEVHSQPEIVITVIIEKSPFNLLAQEEIDSITRFIMQKEHMKKNITNIEYNLLPSRNSECGLFRHTISLRLSVKTLNLWETPRSYVFRHVGQDIWERGNGSEIRITKIHQK